MFYIKKVCNTEKSLRLSEKSQYSFLVDIAATKSEIRKEVAKKYKVTVLAVNTLKNNGKKVKRYLAQRIRHGQAPNYKKAVVTVSSKDLIDVYDV